MSMKQFTRSSTILAAGPAVLLLSGCVTFGTPEAMNPPTAAFVTAIDSASKGVRSDQLANYRRNLRRDAFIETALSLVGDQSVTPQGLAENAPAPVDWLCRPQYSFARVAIPLAALDGLGKTFAERLDAPSDDVGVLIRALGKDYTIAPLEVTPVGSYDQWIHAADETMPGARCRKMVDKGDPFAVRPEAFGTKEAAAIPAAIAFLDAIWVVAKPVAVGALKNVDMERKAAALREYFSDKENIEKTRTQIIALEDFVAKEFALGQKRTAGRAVGTAAVLFDGKAPHWIEVRRIATQKCKGFGKLGPASAPRIACMDAVLGASSAPLDRALDAADAFDASFAQQMPEKKLSVQLDTLHDIALGKEPDEAKRKELWNAAMRYIALFQSVQTAASADNRKKIKDAWDVFQNSMAEGS